MEKFVGLGAQHTTRPQFNANGGHHTDSSWPKA